MSILMYNKQRFTDKTKQDLFEDTMQMKLPLATIFAILIKVSLKIGFVLICDETFLRNLFYPETIYLFCIGIKASQGVFM